MPESPLGIVLQMVAVLVDSIVDTFEKIILLFTKLLVTLGFVSEIGGPIAFVISVVILGLVGFFLARLFFGEGKKLLILIPLGMILLYLLLLGSLV